jgi:hypothetical protein
MANSSYKSYLKEQDILGRKHKAVCLEAEKNKKELPTDPRFIEDPKKSQQAKKDPKKKDQKVTHH